jgi:hypothetical protein
MSSQQRACPYCGTVLAPDQRTCPNPRCGNPYPFDDDLPTLTDDEPAAAAEPPRRAPRNAPRDLTPVASTSPIRTILILVGVLVLIVGLGYLLFQFGVSFLDARRPEPSAPATSTAGPVVVPPALTASPVAGASPSPVTISPGAGASPSPAQPVTRMKIANTEGQGANLRQRPSTTAPVLRTLPEGTVVEVIGGETNAEGRAWRNIRDQAGANGWVAAELLAPE